MATEQPSAAWDVLVLPMALRAETEDEARAEFLQALIEDNSLIRVQPHAEDIYVEGNDAIGI